MKTITKQKLLDALEIFSELKDVAEYFMCSPGTIRNRLKQYNLKNPYSYIKNSKIIPRYRIKQQLEEDYKNCPSTILVAEKYGVTPSTIRHWLVRFNIPRNWKKATIGYNPDNPWTQEDVLREEYSKHGMRTLAKMWNCNVATIANWLNRFEIKKRKPTGGDIIYSRAYESLKRKANKRKNSRNIVRLSRDIKRKIKEDFGRCKLCGYDKHIEILEVHHLDRDSGNNSDDNLCVLCPNCHSLDTRKILRIDKNYMEGK